jgi:luciferase-type oxidoreductase
MEGQEVLARRAEALGFAALWFRDVPLRDPRFGDVGQIYDPWVYLGYVTALTERIALVTGAVVLPIGHPLLQAKAAASVDRLSRGRLVLGIAIGDRAAEAVAFGVPVERRGEILRQHLAVMRRAWGASPPVELAQLGLDVIPRPALGDLPVLAVGRCQQSYEWIAQATEGFVTYPRPPAEQARVVAEYRAAARDAGVQATRGFAQSLYVDLLAAPGAPPHPIHLGWRLGRHALVDVLAQYREVGVQHVVFNLKYGRRPAAEVLEELGQDVLPQFALTKGEHHAFDATP